MACYVTNITRGFFMAETWQESDHPVTPQLVAKRSQSWRVATCQWNLRRLFFGFVDREAFSRFWSSRPKRDTHFQKLPIFLPEFCHWNPCWWSHCACCCSSPLSQQPSLRPSDLSCVIDVLRAQLVKIWAPTQILVLGGFHVFCWIPSGNHRWQLEIP